MSVYYEYILNMSFTLCSVSSDLVTKSPVLMIALCSPCSRNTDIDFKVQRAAHQCSLVFHLLPIATATAKKHQNPFFF